MAKDTEVDRQDAEDRSAGFGERLLGRLLDRAYELPPDLVAPLVAEEVTRAGGREVSLYLEDHAQRMLVPLTGRGLSVGGPLPLEDSEGGRAFLRGAVVEREQRGGLRLFLPLMDGAHAVGVLALTLDQVGEEDRRMLRRLAGLVAELLVTKNSYTDVFAKVRRRAQMSVAAEIQWSLLPPLTMITPRVTVAGALEPAYHVAGDNLDYALNNGTLHLAVIDAAGHGLGASVLTTVASGAYRYARRAELGLAEMYRIMDAVLGQQFQSELFATGQFMRLDVASGLLKWINAGHPRPLLIRDHKVIDQLRVPVSLPVGVGIGDGGSDVPQVGTHQLRPGDRLVLYTDGVVEEHKPGGDLFGEDRLIDCVERIGPTVGEAPEFVRVLSHALLGERGGVTSDDASLFVVEWHGGSPERLAPAGNGA